jgi:hypothetical protein
VSGLLVLVRFDCFMGDGVNMIEYDWISKKNL